MTNTFSVVDNVGTMEAGEREPTQTDSSLVQLTPELIEDLRRRRILREQEQSIDLPNFGPNEERIGVLNDQERAIFVETAVIDATLWDWSKEITARSAEKIAKHIREKDTPQEVVEQMQQDIVFEDDAEAEQYYAEVYRKNYLDALLWYGIRERLGCFGANLAIRYGFSVARLGHKYKIAS